MEKKIQKAYPIDNNLLRAEDLWQAHCQILLIILLKKFIKLTVNMNMMIKNVKFAESNTKIVTAFLNMQTLKIIWWNKNACVVTAIIKKTFDENLKKRFFNICKFSNHDTNKFILLLRNDVYQYKYMDDLGKFGETSLPGKEDFYSHLNTKDISDRDYTHGKMFAKILK